MRYRLLGKTGLEVSILGFGSGGPSQLGQNTGLSSKEQHRLISRVIDLGINLIDSSEAYGDSEEILGKYLKQIPRASYVLATKNMCVNQSGEVRNPIELAQAIDRSLKRLETNHIDVMQFHLLTLSDYEEVIEKLYPVMEKAKSAGKIRFIGFSEAFKIDPSHKAVVHALNKNPDLWDTVMLKYGILNQYAAKEALPLAKKHNIGVINMAVIREKLPNPKLLSNQIKSWKQEGLIDSELDEINPLNWLIKGNVKSIIDAGYIFASEHPAVSSVLTGTSSINNLEKNVQALNINKLPEQHSQKLKDLFSDIAIYI